jgi:hypothetical protein
MWTRVAWVVGLLAATAATAEAKPLPADMKLSLKKGKPYATSQGVTVQLLENRSEWTAVEAELSDDGKQLLVWGARCGMELDKEEVPQRISMFLVDAKLFNAKGLALQAKRKYADAAKLFEQAWARDSESPSYATNLLSALAMSGSRDLATRILQDGVAGEHFAWFALRLGIDPQLKKLNGEPSAKAFRAEKPSRLTQKKLADGFAHSPLGFFALKTSDSSGAKFMSFVRTKTGKEALRLPLKTGADQRSADVLLSSMGFELSPTKPAWSDDAKMRALKVSPGLDLRTAADLGEYLVYVHRTTGCSDADFELHAGTVAIEQAAAED